MATICISSGGTAATVVDPKVIMKHAIERLASGIILVHNHPSSNLLPSPQDDALTRKIKEAGNVLEIKVLDHLIIGADGYYSYSDQGRL
ncbi:MAG: JAB domain-containing protein [Bacteroides sp.]|nr:JAB domain-containing protein [Bacteroides sp.]MCM1412739.1 JAB domain-containing protein [Bacteroides sp.]MCM1470967.1 JAB domain-containing protein [Bacteroides sp.]